ncbi:MAG: hypothetical protein GC182_06595 [Rhodopseudomonas sp.]|nr:hypothetical protein [Rhodopseudomonas sp.]
MDQNWFEFRDIRKKRFNDAVWIPLRESRTEREGEYGYFGYKEDLNLVAPVAIPIAKLPEAEKLGWPDIGFGHSHGVYAFENSYATAESYQRRDEEDFGIHLVIDQDFGGLEPHQWHLNQDLVVALKLLREDDVWVRPCENYIEVARLRRKLDGSTSAIEIRSEYLRDYLAARHMALKISTFRQRDEILADVNHIKWADKKFEQKDGGAEYSGHIIEINEGRGDEFGSTIAVFHVGRNDVDPTADVPIFEPPNDSNVDSKSWTAKREGNKLFHVLGKVWRDELIQPGDKSPRVRGDKIPASCSFIVDAAGNRATSDKLDGEDNARWLWFDPKVIPALESRRGGLLEWYTRYTGGISASGADRVHFGINAKGLINTFASDVARLPEWQQRIWMGYNVSPDGGVSEELLSAQMAAEPARSLAPEDFLERALDNLNDVFTKRWGAQLLRPHKDTVDIIRRTNRFRSTDLPSLLALAKDVARLTADSIDVDPLHKIVPLEKGEKRGSLKSLEKVLATLIPAAEARTIIGPLVGIYNLRVGDAHLAPKEIEKEFALAHVDRTALPVEQGLQLLVSTIDTLVRMAAVIERTPAHRRSPQEGG